MVVFGQDTMDELHLVQKQQFVKLEMVKQNLTKSILKIMESQFVRSLIWKVGRNRKCSDYKRHFKWKTSGSKERRSFIKSGACIYVQNDHLTYEKQLILQEKQLTAEKHTKNTGLHRRKQ